MIAPKQKDGANNRGRKAG